MPTKAASKKTAAKTEEIQTQPETQLAKPCNSTLAGDLSIKDVEFPRLNIAQKMSEFEAKLGSVVIDKEDELCEAEEKLDCVVLSATKLFKQDIPFDEEEVPKIVGTEAEARKLEEEGDWPVIEFAELFLAFIQPKGAPDDLYPYPLGGVNVAIGKLTVQKDAYRRTFKVLARFKALNPDADPGTRIWQFSSQHFQKGKYSWYVPTLKTTTQEAPASVIEFANRLRGGAQDA